MDEKTPDIIIPKDKKHLLTDKPSEPTKTGTQKVTSLTEHKTALYIDQIKEQEAGSHGDKISNYTQMINVVHSINKESFAPLGKFKRDFRLLTFDDYSTLPVIIKNGVVSYVHEDYVVNEIIKFCDKSNLEFSYTKAKQTFLLWKALAKKIREKDIKQMQFKSGKELTWHKMDFDPKEMPTPVFDEMCSRLSAPEELKSFIGSLFFKSDRSQYLWLHGDGGNGKSRLLEFLKKVMGSAYTNEYAPTQQTQRFWTAGLLGKRLVALPDTNSFGFPASGYFKSLTGDTQHQIDKKGIQPFPADIHCKFIFMSNTEPTIKGSEAEVRRAIIIRMEALEENQRISSAEYDRKLYAEREGIISSCMLAFREKNDQGSIRISEETKAIVKEIVESTEEAFELLFDKYFQHTTDQDEWILAAEFSDILKEEGYHPRRLDTRDLRSWLKRKYDVRSVSRRRGGEKVKMYTNIAKKLSDSF